MKKELKSGRRKMPYQQETIDKNRKLFFKEPIKNSEIGSTRTEMKNSLERFHSRSEQKKEIRNLKTIH